MCNSWQQRLFTYNGSEGNAAKQAYSECGENTFSITGSIAAAGLAFGLSLAFGFGGRFVGPGKAFEAVDVAEHLAAWAEQLFLEQGLTMAPRTSHPPFSGAVG